MADPVIADKMPKVMELAVGHYDWCACGRSKGQPFCDGSHGGTGLSPVAFEITTAKKYALCLCKRTATAPFCDGSHKKL